MPRLGRLVHNYTGADAEAIASVPLTSLMIGSCEIERIQKYRALQKLGSFMRTKATIELDQLCKMDLGQLTAELQFIGI